MHNFLSLWDFLCVLSYGNLGMRKEMKINMVLSISVNHHQPSVPPPTHSHPHAQSFMALIDDNTTSQPKHNIVEEKKKKKATLEQLFVL